MVAWMKDGETGRQRDPMDRDDRRRRAHAGHGGAD
jgi:hypothetical protein